MSIIYYYAKQHEGDSGKIKRVNVPQKNMMALFKLHTSGSLRVVKRNEIKRDFTLREHSVCTCRAKKEGCYVELTLVTLTKGNKRERERENKIKTKIEKFV